MEDGDSIIIRGWAQRDGAVRIGFGEVEGAYYQHACSKTLVSLQSTTAWSSEAVVFLLTR